MASGQFVAGAHLAQLGDLDLDALDHARVQFVALLARKDLYPDNAAALAMFHQQRSVFDVLGLLAKDRAQQTFLGGKLLFALGRNLADKDVVWLNLGADAHDAFLIQVL